MANDPNLLRRAFDCSSNATADRDRAYADNREMTREYMRVHLDEQLADGRQQMARDRAEDVYERVSPAQWIVAERREERRLREQHRQRLEDVDRRLAARRRDDDARNANDAPLDPKTRAV